MLTLCIVMTVLLIILVVVVPILANITTPENLTDWYTSKFYLVLIPAGLILLIILWGCYFLLK